MAQAHDFFNLFAQFHAHFGLASRFRDDLTTESMSPLKPRDPAAGNASRILLLNIRFGRCKHSVRKATKDSELTLMHICTLFVWYHARMLT
jgi:hypothetical protein